MDMKMNLPGAMFIAAALVTIGCAHADDKEKRELTVESVPGIAADVGSQAEEPGDPTFGAGLRRLVDMATKDLAASLKIKESDIKVAEAEYVTWRDSSLGCPKPDMQYLQVISNGSRIVLKANGAIYNYHSGGNVPPSYCTKPATRIPLPYEHGET